MNDWEPERRTFERAKQLLLGAVETVLDAANKLGTHDSPGPSQEQLPARASSSGIHASSSSVAEGGRIARDSTEDSTHPIAHVRAAGCSSNRSTDLGSIGLQEHRRLFKFQPSKVATKHSKGKAPVKAKRGKRGPSTWKNYICLSSCTQSLMPTTEERMQLAQMGLGLKELHFEIDYSSVQIHKLILDEYPQLEDAGGYTLLRLAENSRDLVEIETPGGGFTVPYLKDIVRQAKLYIRPLQCDI